MFHRDLPTSTPSHDMPRSQERSLQIISCFLFSASVYWIRKKVQEERRRSNLRQRTKGWSPSQQTTANVSQRCMGALSPTIPYLEAFLTGLQYLCEPGTQPDGYIILCMAENKLVIDVLAERLMQAGTATAAFSDSTVYCYNSFLGIPVARQAAAYFIAKRFLFPGKTSITPDQALQAVNPNHIGIGSGAVGVLNALFFLLGESGDCCLIPAPYYAAFESDMRTVAGIVPFAVHMTRPSTGPTESELDMAYMQARSEGLNPKFVLITNPHNPLGVIYKPSVLKGAVEWARRRSLHTICDELYALSTHDEAGHGFESIVSVLDNKMGNDVHMVWSVSKDFGASGLRVGFVYSQNEIFMQALSNFNIFSGVSNPIQMVVSELLTDDDFVDSYLNLSRERLKESYAICVEKIEEMVLPFVPAVAGQFVYVDFSSLLPERTQEWEKKLCTLMIEHARLILTPGESQRERIPGMFRICYAWVSPEVLQIGMERLSRLVGKIRKMDWSDLDQQSLGSILY